MIRLHAAAALSLDGGLLGGGRSACNAWRPALARNYLPVLKSMPARYIHEPWLAPDSVQKAAKCVVGESLSCRAPAPPSCFWAPKEMCIKRSSSTSVDILGRVDFGGRFAHISKPEPVPDIGRLFGWGRTKMAKVCMKKWRK